MAFSKSTILKVLEVGVGPHGNIKSLHAGRNAGAGTPLPQETIESSCAGKMTSITIFQGKTVNILKMTDATEKVIWNKVCVLKRSTFFVQCDIHLLPLHSNINRADYDFKESRQQIYRNANCGLKERGIARVRTEEVRTLFEFKEVLGRGRFGRVVHAVDKATGIHRAIKILHKHEATPAHMRAAEREIRILRMVNHPNIILLDKVVESATKLYLVFELCRCRLADDFSEQKIYTESQTRSVMNGLANAVAYLHQYDIIHRDLKPENILLATNPNDPRDNLFIKVIDFGLSVVKGGTGYEKMCQDMCGTLNYMAPEILEEKAYGRQCDLWAMGIIMYLLLSGRLPFHSKDEAELSNLIKSKEPDFSEQAWSDAVSEDAIVLVRKLLTKNPAYRITAAELVTYPWIKDEKTDDPPNTNILEMMKLWRQDLLIRGGESNPGKEGHSESCKLIRSRNHDCVTRDCSQFGVIMEKKDANVKLCQLPLDEVDIPIVPARSSSKLTYFMPKPLSGTSNSPGTSGSRRCRRTCEESGEKRKRTNHKFDKWQ